MGNGILSATLMLPLSGFLETLVFGYGFLRTVCYIGGGEIQQ